MPPALRASGLRRSSQVGCLRSRLCVIGYSRPSRDVDAGGERLGLRGPIVPQQASEVERIRPGLAVVVRVEEEGVECQSVRAAPVVLPLGLTPTIIQGPASSLEERTRPRTRSRRRAARRSSGTPRGLDQPLRPAPRRVGQDRIATVPEWEAPVDRLLVTNLTRVWSSDWRSSSRLSSHWENHDIGLWSRERWVLPHHASVQSGLLSKGIWKFRGEDEARLTPLAGLSVPERLRMARGSPLRLLSVKIVESDQS